MEVKCCELALTQKYLHLRAIFICLCILLLSSINKHDNYFFPHRMFLFLKKNCCFRLPPSFLCIFFNLLAEVGHAVVRLLSSLCCDSECLNVYLLSLNTHFSWIWNERSPTERVCVCANTTYSHMC